MIEAHSTARYVRTSAQKAKLVLDLIRGKDVNSALATLRFTRKAVAHHLEKVLLSAIANAERRDGFGGDVDSLVVSECYANQGPSQKRVRPAPMGRAFRVLKRTAHLTVKVQERPSALATEVQPVGAAKKSDTKSKSKWRSAKRKQVRTQASKPSDTSESAVPISSVRASKSPTGSGKRGSVSRASKNVAQKTRRPGAGGR